MRPYEVLAAQRLLPVLRSADADEAVRATATLLAAGCRAVELTTSVPGWAGAVARTAGLADALGRPALIGVGTVTTAAQARAALDAGAGFLVSPYPAPEVREVARRRGAAFVEGGYTPGEIAAAVRRSGAAKVFPAHVGGPAFLRSLRAVLPDGALLIPTGGIAPGEVRDWLAAGASAVGIGSGLPTEPAELAALFASLASDAAPPGGRRARAHDAGAPAHEDTGAPPGHPAGPGAAAAASDGARAVPGTGRPAPGRAPRPPVAGSAPPGERPAGPEDGAAGPGGRRPFAPDAMRATPDAGPPVPPARPPAPCGEA
ncbi:hypothetical protein GCM10010302_27370 [Streptomyces polychromogenes]|uniref:Aldolase n=1 Tax=Streptomyces polychromogenes TaxID=67342 RepID=A0ABP3F075_9ACTN